MYLQFWAIFPNYEQLWDWCLEHNFGMRFRCKCSVFNNLAIIKFQYQIYFPSQDMKQYVFLNSCLAKI